PFVGSTEVGTWRPTDSFIGTPPAPAPFSPMVTPWLAETTPFTLTSPRRFRAPPPPALTSKLYTQDYAEVMALGAFNSTMRTAEQTDLAYFYNDNFFTQWNWVLRGVAQQRVHRIGDSARLFALANMASADALITCWDSKKTYVFWQPLVNTPNYPDYTSGANSLVAAMTRTLEMFFGSDRGPLEVTSLHSLAVKKTRSYARFSDAAVDVVEA